MRGTALIFLSLALLCGRSDAMGRNPGEIDVPWFSQVEPWGEEPLGDSTLLNLARSGCALTSCAMVLSCYGIRTNPVELNAWLLKNRGYDKGWDEQTYLGQVRIIWDVIASGYDEVDLFRRYDFSHLPADLYLIRGYLDAGIPVIAEVLRPGNIQHFVVLTGYEGEDFLIRDPLSESTRYLSEAYNISDRWGEGAARNIFSVRIFIPRR